MTLFFFLTFDVFKKREEAVLGEVAVKLEWKIYT